MRTFIFLLLMALLASCSGEKQQKLANNESKSTIAGNSPKPKKAKDTIKFDYQYFHLDQKYCKNKERCNFVELSYPVFNANDRLNASIKKQIFSFINGGNEESSKTTATLFKTFAEDFLGDLQGDDEDVSPVQSLSLTISIMRQDSGFISLDVINEQSGGAHPNTSITYINWNTKTDKAIKLADILISNYKAPLIKIAEGFFRTERQLSKNQPLDDFTFKDNQFGINDNFYLNEKGINFYYNSYEIAAYALGPTDLLVPYSAINHLLRPNTVISQYLK